MDKLQLDEKSNIGSKLSDFKVLSELGRGSYGVIYKVESLLTHDIYVLKKMDLKHMKEKQQKESWKEAMILKKVHHTNIIKYFASFLEEDSLYILMEYAEGGDLYSLIKYNKKQRKNFSEEELWRYTYEILLGLDYLHSNNIIHRDIKCLNLFITKEKKVKIGDLGVSKIVSNINALHCTRVGTPLYLAPELIRQTPYDFKVDMWSVGCSIYHLASLDPPFSGDNLIILGNNIVKNKPKPLPSIYSSEFCDLVEKLLSKKPDNRPTVKEALALVPDSIKHEYANAAKQEKELKKSKTKEAAAFEEIPSLNADTRKAITARPFSGIGIKRNENNHFDMINVNTPLKDVEDRNDMKKNNQDNDKLKDHNKLGGNLYSNTPMSKDSTPRENLNNFLRNNKQPKPVVQITTPTIDIIDKSPSRNQPLLNKENSNIIFKTKTNLKTESVGQPQPTKNSFTALETASVYDNIITKKSKKENSNLNFIQNVENFMIHTQEQDEEEEENKQIIKNKQNVQNVQNVNIDKSKIKEQDNKIVYINENYEQQDNDFILPGYSPIPNLKNNMPVKRLLSSKVRNNNKFRPNTASNNKILVYHMPSSSSTDNFFNGNKQNNINDLHNKPVFNQNPYPNIKSNRPLTAIEKNRNEQALLDNNNVINININFYNVDMNQKYIKPNPSKNLYYINDSLFKKEKERGGSSLPPFAEKEKEGKSEKMFSNFRPQTGWNKNNSNNNEKVFTKILKAIEHLNNGNIHKRRLTVNDLKK